MPHYAYYFDSLGNKRPSIELTDDFKVNKQAYIQYLVYANKKLLQLVDFIKANSSKPPVIILMSDHGFRQYPHTVDGNYQFMNLNTVFFPDSNYSGFYPGMTNVNNFRVILNSQFGQKLTMLPDSTSFLKE
jgi:hypothetical protein